VADAFHREWEAGGLDALAETPRRELAAVIAVRDGPGAGLRFLMAIASALVTSEVACRIDQPTTCRK
jgi:hypothetical protein